MDNRADFIDRLITQAHRIELLACLLCCPAAGSVPEFTNEALDGMAGMLDECHDVMREAIDLLRNEG